MGGPRSSQPGASSMEGGAQRMIPSPRTPHAPESSSHTPTSCVDIFRFCDEVLRVNNKNGRTTRKNHHGNSLRGDSQVCVAASFLLWLPLLTG